MKLNSNNHHQKLKITINEKLYLVEVGGVSDSPITVTVNGQPYLVNVETDGVERLSIKQATTTVPGLAAPQLATLDRVAPLTNLVGLNSKQVKAPLPGHIVEIMVHPGDEVRVGQELCSLEAMKMKNAIRSSRNGVVTSVEVSLGQAVAYGDVLVTFA
ncbi:MAG: acetyl-CoA carboxylase biotin carboxyl carrier protein subunit [Anaerolineae bacterium]|nr:acetyl-CoA carboxylase biotin carboxyl carrier protein subunit [Anaerolineae bacterium]